MGFDLSDKNFLTKLRKQVKYLCGAKYTFANADDMFQSICLKIIERPDTKATIENLFVDALRDEYGKKDSVSYELRVSLMRAARYNDVMKQEFLESHEQAVINKLDVEKMLVVVDDPLARQILFDVYFFDWQKNEIAEKLNVSPQWVTQKEKWAFEDIRDEYPENIKLIH